MRHSLYHCSHQLLTVILVVALFVGFCDARRLVAIGDLHGDYNQSLAVFRLTRLIDDRNHWIGEDAYLVQLGDILDVGPDDIRIVEFLMKMQRSAQKRGGDVVQLLGNHEIRNFRGDYRAVDPSSLSRSGGPKGRDYQLSNQTTIGRYLRTRKAIFHYGPFLFMHGGFSTATSNKLTSLRKVDQFNEELTRALMDGRISPLARHGLNLNEDDADDVENPILVRSLLNVKCKDLAAVLDKKFKGIQSVVVGHVPHDPQDFSDWRLCDGRLIDIDFGMSRWKKGDPGHVAALEIESSTWHVQLIEATMRFIDTADSLAEDGPESAAVPIRFLRLSMFLVGLVLAVVAVLALLCWSEWKKHRPALGTMSDCGTYGATA